MLRIGAPALGPEVVVRDVGGACRQMPGSPVSASLRPALGPEEPIGAGPAFGPEVEVREWVSTIARRLRRMHGNAAAAKLRMGPAAGVGERPALGPEE